MGKRKPVDKATMSDMARCQMSNVAIAAKMGIHKTTLYRRYATYIEEQRQVGVADLLEMAWLRAKCGQWEAIKYLLDRFLPDTLPTASSEVNVNLIQQNLTVNQQPAKLEKSKVLQLYDALLEEDKPINSVESGGG